MDLMSFSICPSRAPTGRRGTDSPPPRRRGPARGSRSSVRRWGHSAVRAAATISASQNDRLNRSCRLHADSITAGVHRHGVPREQVPDLGPRGLGSLRALAHGLGVELLEDLVADPAAPRLPEHRAPRRRCPLLFGVSPCRRRTAGRWCQRRRVRSCNSSRVRYRPSLGEEGPALERRAHRLLVALLSRHLLLQQVAQKPGDARVPPGGLEPGPEGDLAPRGRP